MSTAVDLPPIAVREAYYAAQHLAPTSIAHVLDHHRHVIWSTDWQRAFVLDQWELALRIATQPLEGPQPGPQCNWCGDPGAFATWRVWDDYDPDPLDEEVCVHCRDRMLEDAPEWVQFEPMTPSDFRRRGVDAVDEEREVSPWDTAAVAVGCDLGADALVFGGAA